MRFGTVAVILGGGGLVTRHNEGELEILMVHRPKHLDWSLPAGRLDPGETLAECALREVHEETGYVCELGRELGMVDYTDRRGRTRQVYYWEMDAISGSFTPNPEVDAIDWVERIPFTETRQYVKKIMTGLQIFRARIEGPDRALRIVQDLNRYTPPAEPAAEPIKNAATAIEAGAASVESQ